MILTYWFLVYCCTAIITLTLSWSVFYPNYLYITSGTIPFFASKISSIWTLRLYFYFLFLPIHLICFLSICWVYSRVHWFGGKIWIISLTFLISERLSSVFWIWYFNRQLPDMWMVWGMVSLLFCLAMSAYSHSQ